MLQTLLRNLEPKSLFPSLTIGFVVGIQNAILALAFAVMIFSGDLAPYIATGITILLLGNIIHSVIVALGSSLPGTITAVQDSPAVIIAIVATAMLASMPEAGPETKFYTVLAAIMLSTLLTGLIYLLLGKFKLGNLVSFMPYPVVGGFLAGTGLLLVMGSLQVMSGEAVTLLNLSPLFQTGAWLRWIPGVVFAIVLFGLVMRAGHYLVLPGVLAATIAIFYGTLAATNTPVAEAARAGWLVSGMPQGETLFRLWNPLGFARVDWGVLIGQAGSLLACAVISLLSLLLNITALGLSTGQEIDLNNELENNGWANLLSGAGGSLIGYPLLGSTSLAYRLGARNRLNGIFVASVIGLTLALGGSFLGYFPNLMLGGLLFFIGLDFLYSWLYRTWFNMPRIDYAIVILIAVIINTAGFLEGVGVGIGLAVVLFVLQYSRTYSIRHTFSGISYQSSVDRPRMYTQLLRRKGDWLYILELQGFIFFGTATQILDHLRQRLDASASRQAPRFIILDFRLVTGIDSSAAFSFAKIMRLAKGKEIELVLTHLDLRIQKQLHKELPPGTVHYFPDLDHGVEWCENEMAGAFESVGLAARPASLFKQLIQVMPDAEAVETLKQHLQLREIQPGERIIDQGSKQCDLYMIETGKVTIQLECEDGCLLRLRSLGPGNFFGEMGIYTGEPASANVIAEQPTRLYRLRAEDLAHLEQAAPVVAAALHRFVVAYMSERLAKTTTTLQALLQ